MSEFKTLDCLSSNNFARQSDVVFSEVISKKEFENLILKI